MQGKRGKWEKTGRNRSFTRNLGGLSRGRFLELADDVSDDIGLSWDVSDVQVKVMEPLQPADLAREGVGHFL